MSNYKRNFDSTLAKKNLKSPTRGPGNLPVINPGKQGFPMTPSNDRSKSYMCQKDIESQYKILVNDNFQTNFLRQIKVTKNKPHKLHELTSPHQERDLFTPTSKDEIVDNKAGLQTKLFNERLVSFSVDTKSRQSDLKHLSFNQQIGFNHSKALNDQTLTQKSDKLKFDNGSSMSLNRHEEGALIDYFPKRQETAKKVFFTVRNSPGRKISPRQPSEASNTRIDFNTQKDELLSMTQSMNHEKLVTSPSPVHNKKLGPVQKNLKTVTQSLNLSTRINNIQIAIDPLKQSQLENNLRKSLIRPSSKNLSRGTGPLKTVTVDRYGQTNLLTEVSVGGGVHSSALKKRQTAPLDRLFLSPKQHGVKTSSIELSLLRKPMSPAGFDVQVTSSLSQTSGRQINEGILNENRPKYLNYNNFRAQQGFYAAKKFVTKDSMDHVTAHESKLRTMQQISLSLDNQSDFKQIFTQSSAMNKRPANLSSLMPRSRRLMNQSADGVTNLISSLQSTTRSFDSDDKNHPIQMQDALEIDTLDVSIKDSNMFKYGDDQVEFDKEFQEVNDLQNNLNNRLKNFMKNETNRQLFKNVQKTMQEEEERRQQNKIKDMQLKAKFSDKNKVNELIIGLIADDATKRADNSQQVKGLEEIFNFMDERQKLAEHGKAAKFSEKEMKKLMKNLEFMRQMSEEKRRKFADRIKELIENFEANTEAIVQDTLDQIKILKSYIDEVNMSLGNMQVLNSVVKDKKYNDNNQVLIEMLDFGKADPNFTSQVEEADPETRGLINQLIKSLEDEAPPEEKMSTARRGSESAGSKDQRRSSFLSTGQKPVKTAIRFNESAMQKIEEDENDYCETPKWDVKNAQKSFKLPKNFMKNSPSKVKLQINDNQMHQFETSDQLTSGLKQRFSILVQHQARKDDVFQNLGLAQVKSNAKNFKKQLFTIDSKASRKQLFTQERAKTIEMDFLKSPKKLNKIKPTNSVQVQINDRDDEQNSSSNSNQTETFTEGEFSSNQDDSNSDSISSQKQQNTETVESPGIDGGVANKNKGGGYSLIRKDKRVFGPACQKFREIVQKHFLTKSLAQLEEMDAGNISINLLLLLGELKSALYEILPEGSLDTMGEKYKYIDKNLYANEFLQNLLSDVPGFGDKLNLKQTKKIEIELKAREKAAMEQMEKSQMDFIDENQSKIDDMQSRFNEKQIQNTGTTDQSLSNLSVVEVNQPPPSGLPNHGNSKMSSALGSPMRFGRKGNLGESKEPENNNTHISNITNIQKQRRLLKQNTQDNFSLNQLFLQQTEKIAFYNLAKKKHVKIKEDEDMGKKAMRQYYDRCTEKGIKAQPFFISYTQNTLFLSQENVSLEHGRALNEYLETVRSVKEKVIYKLVIDQCSMKDEVFAEILEGCFKQCQMMQNGKIEVQYLTTLVYTGNQFGPKSLKVLSRLLPGFVDFTFANISNQGGFSRDIMGEIMRIISVRCKKLIKIKISNINLNHKDMVNGICTILQKSKLLQSIDFSWASLSPKQLAQISQNFEQRLKSLRSINMSYNQANVADWQEDPNSEHGNFVDNLINFLENAMVVNHLKLSGMGLKMDQVIKICEQAIICPLMLAIHLNDNNITTDMNNFLPVLDIFGMGEEDLLDTNRSIKNQRMIPPKQNQNALVRNQHDIDYKTVMKVYMGFQPQRFVDKQAFEADEALQVQRKIYKDHILLGKNQKIVDNMKAINTSQVTQGIGKLDDNEVDHLVISRIVNYPELIFNQRIKNDDSKQFKFFQKDAGMKWALSKANECYVCQKYRYTIVFYEKGLLSNNQGLIEVHDKKFLAQMRADFQREYIRFQSTTPLICGTIVNKQKGMPQFHRKLKMIRASLFTLMCISGSKIFIGEKYQTHKLKNGCIRYLDFDNVEVLEGMSIKEKLDGWQHVLDDKCNYNELTDVTRVNAPSFDEDLHKKDFYVFAGFLNPGYHQVLIYDPELDRAFVKDFIVGINQKDFYPEFPLLHGAKSVKTVQNVWRNWVETTEEDQRKSFRLDTHNNDEFDISLFIRKPEDATKCLGIMLQNFETITIYQRELLVGSKFYPQIDFFRVCAFFDWIYANTPIPKKNVLIRAILENQFIRATRFDETPSLQSAMQRMELYDFLLRIGQQWSYQVYTAKDMLCEHLQEFIDLFMKPLVDQSLVKQQRTAMRASAKLNELLFDNLKGLEKIFEEYKENNQFTQDSAVNFVQKHEILAKNVDNMTIQRCFIFSQMTVLNEQRGLERYGYLQFVEFLDMLCRLAQECIKVIDTYENKVYEMLSYIYMDRYKAGVWVEEDWPLYEVNDDVDC